MLYYVKPAEEGSEEEKKEESQHSNEMIEPNQLMITRNLSSALFTGDTIFNGGCGRFFEGKAPEMKHAFDVLRTFPDSQRFFHGHEYTVSSLEFGAKAEPDNKDIQKWLEEYREMRKKGEFSHPSTVGREKKVNIFMRTGESYLQMLTESTD